MEMPMRILVNKVRPPAPLNSPFSWHVKSGKEISDQTHEHRHVVRDDFRNVEITQGSHQHLIFRTAGIRTTQSTGHDQHRLDGS